MKLTALEVGNYLVRFYEELEKRVQNGIPQSDDPGADVIKINNTFGFPCSVCIENSKGDKIYCALAWSEYCKFLYAHALYGQREQKLSHKLKVIGKTGLAYITILDYKITEGVEIPFTLKFDMRQDVDNFLKRISKIERYSSFPEQVIPARGIAVVDGELYFSESQ
ncbi:hypothetical protein [Methylobacter sp.]